MVRIPESIVFSAIQPMLLVLMFRYVFGGAITGIHGSYVNYLMPGIFVQTVTFGSVNSAVGMAEDLQKGIIERFRALPMARPAVVTGRSLSDLTRNVVSVLLMTGLGFAVGFRIADHRGRLRGRARPPAPVLLGDRVGLLPPRPRGEQPRDRPAGHVPGALALHLRLLGVRAGAA